MKDRIPTKILENGALRYGVYDESGNLLRYEYIKPEDEPTDEGTPINKATLLSDLTASLYGLPDPTVNDLLGVLSGAAMIKQEPLGVSTTLSAASDGATLVIPINGVPTDFYVVQQNYPSSGNVLLLLKYANIASASTWATTSGAVYDGSLADAACQNYVAQMDTKVKDAIPTVNISSFGTTLARKCFLLSATELGNYGANTPLYTEGTTLNSSAIATIRTTSENYWSRSARDPSSVIYYYATGTTISASKYLTSATIRPAFCLPSNFAVYKVGNVYYLEQQYAPPAAATVLGNIIGGFTRIETGEYTGTGTYGAGSPNVLTLGFVPKVMLLMATTAVGVSGSGFAIAINGAPYLLGYKNNYSMDNDISVNGGRAAITFNANGTASWYATEAARQFNLSGEKYVFVVAA